MPRTSSFDPPPIEQFLTDYEVRLDPTGPENQPSYVGFALQGTASSATTWTVKKLSYDTNNELTHVQVLTGSWDGRAALPWS